MKKLSIVFAFVFLAVPVMADRYYVKTDSRVVRAIFGSVHNFPGAFSAELNQGQLRALEVLGIETEPVGIFSITKPFCNNNGVCESELGENPAAPTARITTKNPPLKKGVAIPQISTHGVLRE